MLSLWIFIKFNNAWKGQMTKSELKRITNIINDSPSLPESLYQLHDSIYKNCRQRKAIWGLVNRIKEETKKYPLDNNPFKKSIYKLDSPVNWVVHPLTSNGVLKDTLYGYWFISGIKRYSSPEKCFDYYLLNADFTITENDTIKNRIKGVENLSRHLFDKELQALENREFLKLFEVLENQDEFMILTRPHIY